MTKRKEVTEEDNKSYPEHILIAVLQQYEDSFNNTNDKYELKFQMTLTNQKQAMPEGNKDLAYLRIERAMRPKGSEEEWSMELLHSDMYIFKSLTERVNPKAAWKEQLFVNCLAHLTAMGLEYAELLRRTKQQRAEKLKELEKDKPELIITSQMPSPLTKDEKEYAEWVKKEKQKEGL